MSEAEEAAAAPLPGFVRRYRSAAGGCVDVHETHGKQETRQNLPIAIFLADLGERVRLLRVLTVAGAKNPDASRNGVEWEFKTPEGRTANAIDKALRGANRQAARVLIQVHPDFNRRVLEQAIYDRVRRAENIFEVAILLRETVHHFTRQEIILNTFRGKMG